MNLFADTAMSRLVLIWGYLIDCWNLELNWQGITKLDKLRVPISAIMDAEQIGDRHVSSLQGVNIVNLIVFPYQALGSEKI